MTARVGVRLAAVLVLVTLTVLVALINGGAPAASGAPPSPSSAPPAVSAGPGPPATTEDERPSRAPDATVPTLATSMTGPGPEEVAVQAVNAWQSDTDEQRADALSTVATAAFQVAALTIDATRVPSAAPTVAVTRVEADGQALVDVELEDGTDLALVLLLEQDRWLVDDVQPVTPPAGAGAP